ncbi:MAG: hypothetical protein M1833_003983 [Piccolia ochrophora]|nr:MAG: hypothetical protein M1833_003983 [Piccolia ochrophora]
MKTLSLIASFFGFAAIAAAAAFPQPGGPVTADAHSKDVNGTRLEARREKYLTGFRTVYGDRENERPSDVIGALNGASTDMNKGFGGKYVWLVPTWSNDFSAGASELMYHFTKDFRDGRGFNWGNTEDLAKGAGGSWRYIYWYATVGESITDVAIWRTSSLQSKPPSGWARKTLDINEARGGDYFATFDTDSNPARCDFARGVKSPTLTGLVGH